MQPQDAKNGKLSGATIESERDSILLGIAIAATILFVGTGGSVLSSAVASLRGISTEQNSVAASALLLNIALILFSWRRHGQLSREVAERRRAEAYARQLAETDALTGCINRRKLPEGMAELSRLAHGRGDVLATILIDLDNFKQVNDCDGHLAGDAVLQEAARRIRALLPEDSLLARLGGDEFLVAVTFSPNRSDRVDRLATQIIAELSRPYAVDGMSIAISASLGLARSDTAREHSPSQDESLALLRMADIAMYQSKRSGRNRHLWFDPQMEREQRIRKELETCIRRGIPAGEFVPYYEQQIDIATGRLTGFEMLARWHSPALGLVNPETFIPVAEEIGLIGNLSESLIAQALIDARAWNPALVLSVNISAVQLCDPWFAQKILKLLVQTNFPPKRLQIEITESCMMENPAMAAAMIASLKAQGIRICLDDFSTGEFSAPHLGAFAFDCIKTDRSLISKVNGHPDSRAIGEAIAALRSKVNLPVTIKGIEDQALLELLRNIGKLGGQGHLFGFPETSQTTATRLAALDLLAGHSVTGLDRRKESSQSGIR